MLPLRFVETDREGFEEPVVEIWRDDEFIGMVFWDGDATIVQIFPEGDGTPKDLELGELMRVLELSGQIAVPEEGEGEFEELRAFVSSSSPAAQPPGLDDEGWDEEDSVVLELVSEFDPQAVHRSADGESFFLREVAAQFIKRSEELDLAVVEMEAFDWDGYELTARPNLNLLIRTSQPESWVIFRPKANFEALDVLGRWPDRETLVVAFVAQQPNGETFVA